MLRRLRRLLSRTQTSRGAQHHDKNPTPDDFALAQQERQLRITLRATRPKSEERFSVAQCHATRPGTASRRAAHHSISPKKNEASLHPPHVMPECESTGATLSTEGAQAPIPGPSWKYQSRAARS